MSLGTTLETILRGSGGLGIALMGNDGIPILQQGGADPAANPLEDELGAAGVEFGRILAELRKASDSVGGGAVNDVSIALARFSMLLRNVDDDCFLVLALPPDGNLGKARYLMRRHMLDLRQDL